MITNPHRWNIGAARLKGLIIHLPLYATEDHVNEYHSILADFQESSDRDFSPFKVPDYALSEQHHKPPTHPFLSPNDTRRYCDKEIFTMKVFGLANYAAGQVNNRPNYGPKTPENLPDPKELASQIFIGQMTGSQFVQNSPNANLTLTYDPTSADFKTLLEELKTAIPKLGLDPDAAVQIHGDVGTIQLQIGMPTPNKSIIAHSLSSIRNILEGAVGSLIASGFLLRMMQYFPK